MTTFFGAPSWDGDSPAIVLWGAPYDRTVDVQLGGSKAAPAALRDHSRQLPLLRDEQTGRPLGWFHSGLGQTVLAGIELCDGGDVPLPAELDGEVADQRVERQAHRIIRAGGRSCLIGGEHALTRGALRGVARALGERSPAVGPPVLVFFDAHPDRGLSHWGGRYPRDSFVDGILADGSVAAILQLGLRDIVHHSIATVPAGLTPRSVRDVRRAGPMGVLATLDRLAPARPLYLSVDIDVLEPAAAPATRTPVPGGLSHDELLELLARLAASRAVVGLDLMELAPERDRAGLTVAAALELLLVTLDASGPT